MDVKHQYCPSKKEDDNEEAACENDSNPEHGRTPAEGSRPALTDNEIYQHFRKVYQKSERVEGEEKKKKPSSFLYCSRDKKDLQRLETHPQTHQCWPPSLQG